MQYILTIFIFLFTLNANAIWLKDSSNYSSSAMHKSQTLKMAIKEEPKNLDACYDKCVIDVDMLKLCRDQAETKQERAACIDFSKRECLMKCKEEQFKNNTVSLLVK